MALKAQSAELAAQLAAKADVANGIFLEMIELRAQKAALEPTIATAEAMAVTEAAREEAAAKSAKATPAKAAKQTSASGDGVEPGVALGALALAGAAYYFYTQGGLPSQ